MAKMTWSDLSATQQRLVYVAAAVEVVLTATVLFDLARRPGSAVHGSRLAWAVSCVVQPVGPLAYLAYGRIRE